MKDVGSGLGSTRPTEKRETPEDLEDDHLLERASSSTIDTQKKGRKRGDTAALRPYTRLNHIWLIWGSEVIFCCTLLEVPLVQLPLWSTV